MQRVCTGPLCGKWCKAREEDAASVQQYTTSTLASRPRLKRVQDAVRERHPVEHERHRQYLAPQAGERGDECLDHFHRAEAAGGGGGGGVGSQSGAAVMIVAGCAAVDSGGGCEGGGVGDAAARAELVMFECGGGARDTPSGHFPRPCVNRRGGATAARRDSPARR